MYIITKCTCTQDVAPGAVLKILSDRDDQMETLKSRPKKVPRVKLQNIDGSSYLLDRKDHIKYLGVMIDESLSWKYHISYTCSRISSNIGVISKLRHYLSIRQLKQLYYNLIYPYLSYAIIAWGSAYKTHLQRLQSKQNTVLRLMFFATTSGPYTESALPFLNLLDVLTVNNVYRLHALKFTHLWHKGLLPSLITFSNMLVIGIHTIQGMHRSKTSVNRVLVLTLENKCFPIKQ